MTDLQPPQQAPAPPPTARIYAAPRPSNGVGLAALIVGIVSLVGAFIPFLDYVTGVGALAALILGIVGLARVNRPKAAALIGLILGAIAIVMSIVMAVVYTVAFAALGSSSNSSNDDSGAGSATAPTAAAPVDSRQPVTFSGAGELSSSPQPMSGNYSVSWTTSDDCAYYAELTSGDDSEDAFSADNATSGTSNMYGLASAPWYMKMITGPAPDCNWTVTFTPN